MHLKKCPTSGVHIFLHAFLHEALIFEYRSLYISESSRLYRQGLRQVHRHSAVCGIFPAFLREAFFSFRRAFCQLTVAFVLCKAEYVENKA